MLCVGGSVTAKIRCNTTFTLSRSCGSLPPPLGCPIPRLNLVATFGWKLLPWYRFDAETAGWEHVDGRGHTPFRLFDIDYSHGELSYDAAPEVADDYELASYTTAAKELFESIDPSTGPSAAPLHATASFEDLRWFLLPEDVRSGE